MSYKQAIARKPGRNLGAGLTTANLPMPDYELALVQHQAYLTTLEQLGLGLLLLEPLEQYPDAYFVEDVAVVMDELAIISRPGAEARRGEELAMAPVLANYKRTAKIEAPGCLDGGDILLVDRHFFVGLSERTNEEGAAQFGRLVEEYGYSYQTVSVGAGLHFKSSVNWVGGNRLLVSSDFAGREELAGYELIIVSDEEQYAGNTLWINDHLLMPKGYPDTKKKLEALQLPIIELDMSEMRKMDGGLTCLSLRF